VSRLARLTLLAPILLLTACFQGQRVIKVGADGSGTVVDTLVLGQQLKAMMAAKATGPEAVAEEKRKYEATAAAMGPGVTFVSEETRPDGFVATYAFKEIGQIQVEAAPGPGGDKDSGQASKPLRFRLTRHGAKSVLTVVQPQPEPAAPGGELPEGMRNLASGMWTMMRGMLKGLRVQTRVDVDGVVTRTTSRYRQGSSVTLLELDFDQITATDANFEKFTRAGDDPSTMDARKLQGVKGVKVNPEPEVVIEFTSN
jgi:hypothetical protein